MSRLSITIATLIGALWAMPAHLSAEERFAVIVSGVSGSEKFAESRKRGSRRCNPRW